MKRSVIAIIVLMAIAASTPAETPRRLGEVIVTAQRPLKEIGMDVTAIDSTSLRDNISFSMADVIQNGTSVYVKNYGRATLSTVAFRGTSPSHTQVTWNGMRVNSPMLGMTDFSTIPSFFVDKASVHHGSASLTETGGGIGGLVSLSTAQDVEDGWGVKYVQGIGSFRTFDEFARVTYGSEHWQFSTRVAYSSSPNDFKYVNHDKKVNIYDDNHQIVGQYHPRERNKGGAYSDFNLLQEVGYNTNKGDRIWLNAWYTRSNRELPLLTTDYGKALPSDNRQREQSFRGVLSWRHNRSQYFTQLSAGYTHDFLAYDYKRATSPSAKPVAMTRSRSTLNTFYLRGDADYSPVENLYLSASVAAYQHLALTSDIDYTSTSGIQGYDQGRVELSTHLSARWQPIERLGLSLLIREEMFGGRWSPVIPAFYADWLLVKRGVVRLRGSISRNHRFPSLNDLYFKPGGNPKLRSETGFTYDVGASFAVEKPSRLAVSGSASFFDSRIDDWIQWLPTSKGFYTPSNLRRVHAYGVECNLNGMLVLPRGWRLDGAVSYSWTPSISHAQQMSEADRAAGNQLPYVPRHSATATIGLEWRGWAMRYRWNYYSRRYTQMASDQSRSGYLPPYFMNGVSLEKTLQLKFADLGLKLVVNNLFDEEYLSVLSRPMPGTNFEFFVSITPKIACHK